VRDDAIIDKLRERADMRMAAAEEQSQRYGDYADHCRREGKLLHAAADSIERLLDELRKASVN
jgi:hypothetical protein